MAASIKGITIELNGDVTKLDQALKGVNATSKALNAELKEIEKQLKFNPGNTTLLEQQQRALASQVEETAKKLDTLKIAAQQAQQQLAAGTLGQDKFDALQREIIATETALQSYEKRLQASKTAQQDIADGVQKLSTFFDATKTSVANFSDVLGSNLTNALKEGRASASQLETALDKIGAAFLGAEGDIEAFKNVLGSVDDASDLSKVSSDLDQLKAEAASARSSIDSLGTSLRDIAGFAGLQEAAEGIKSAFADISDSLEGVLESASQKSKIKVSLDLDEKGTQAVQNAVIEVQKYGLEADEALQGVRRQWQLNSDATDAANAKVVEYAAALTNVYSGLDFGELIQETNEIGSALNISNEQAIGLVNSLLEIGFPVEQLDIISEYGTQLEMAGFSAQEVQAIMAAGVDTKTWNIDNLLDGLKEGRVRLAEFGQEIPASLTPLLEQAGIATEKMQEWGQAVAKGGEGGRKAMLEVADALMSVEDETLRNALGVEIFGTMWEDQGDNIIETLQGMSDHMGDASQNQEKLNNLMDVMNSDPMVALKDAALELSKALLPAADALAKVTSKVAEFAAAHPTLTSAIASVVAVIGTLVGLLAPLGLAFVSLKPAISGVGTVLKSLGTVGGVVSKAFGLISSAIKVVIPIIAGLSGPVLAAIAVIAGLATVAILVKENWETIGPFLQSIWETISATAMEIWGGIKEFFATLWDSIVEAWTIAWETISTTIMEIWTVFIETVQTIWGTIKEFFITLWDSIVEAWIVAWETISTTIMEIWTVFMETVQTVWGTIKEFFATIWDAVAEAWTVAWETITTTVTTIWQSIVDAVTTVFGPIVDKFQEIWDKIKTAVDTAWAAIKAALEAAWEAIKSAAAAAFSAVVSTIQDRWNDAKSKSQSIWNSIKSTLDGIWNNIKSNASSIFNAIVSTIQDRWNAAKSATQSAWEAIKSTVTSAINATKDAVSNGVNAIKSNVTDAFNGAKDAATNAFNALKSGVSSAINAAKDTIGNAVSAIKGFFDGLVLRIPEIQLPRLPRIGISGSFSINPPSVPTFYWAAKGGIFDSPQIIGVGEAGKEAVVPIKQLVPLLADALREIGMDEMPAATAGGDITINVQRMEVRNDNDIQAIAKELYRMIERNKRGKGLRTT